jgi:acetoin utilization deacetylase AcuC-like enzyme
MRVMSAGAVLFVDDPRFDHHQPPGAHPERPARLQAARSGATAACAAAGAQVIRVEPRSATDTELARVHDPRLLEHLARLRGRAGYLDADTYVSGESVDVARLAAGSLAAMIESLVAGRARKGVALLRPPGHHARPAEAMGFCLLNNVAVAAAHARSLGIERVAVVDWDVHHGNGTQEIFWRDPSVLYVSTHQFPFYPGTGAVEETGEGEGRGFTVNVPLAAGGGDAVYAAAFERVILPVLSEYAPQLVLVSAGFDASDGDPLAQMRVSAGAFGWMARELAQIAARSAEGRMAVVLEGGYDLTSLERGVCSTVSGMLGGDARELRGALDDADVARAAARAREAWRVVP